MIVYDLACANGHRFEGWFADADSFEQQRSEKLVGCPLCVSVEVERVLSVPRIGTGASERRLPAPDPRLAKMMAMQRAMLENSTWVGSSFAERARSMAEGAEPTQTIHGQATVGEARELHDDGISVLPLPFPVIPPEQRN